MNSRRTKISSLAGGLFLFVPLAVSAQQPVAEGPVAAAETTPAANEVPVAPKPVPDATQPVDPNQPEKVDRRILGVLPNYRTADGRAPFQPINWKYKLAIASKDSFDWPNYIVGGAFAGLYMADRDHPDFGQGVSGFARYYGTSYADQVIGNMLTEGFMPIVFHEDPRYFRKATGPVRRRLFYSLTRVLICKTDHGNTTFNFAEVVGNSIGGSISNFYYTDERSLNQTVIRTGTQIATDALSNTLKEFWPDIKRHLHHHKTADLAVAEAR
jgi:hypothetical protein